LNIDANERRADQQPHDDGENDSAGSLIRSAMVWRLERFAPRSPGFVVRH
jgi:hypothetical protein